MHWLFSFYLGFSYPLLLWGWRQLQRPMERDRRKEREGKPWKPWKPWKPKGKEKGKEKGKLKGKPKEKTGPIKRKKAMTKMTLTRRPTVVSIDVNWLLGSHWKRRGVLPSTSNQNSWLLYIKLIHPLPYLELWTGSGTCKSSWCKGWSIQMRCAEIRAFAKGCSEKKWQRSQGWCDLLPPTFLPSFIFIISFTLYQDNTLWIWHKQPCPLYIHNMFLYYLGISENII